MIFEYMQDRRSEILDRLKKDGLLKVKRVVRGREVETRQYYQD